MKKKNWLLLVVVMALILCSCGSSGEDAGKPSEDLSGRVENADLPEEIVEAIKESEDGAYDVQVEEKKLALYLAEGEFVLGGQYEGDEVVFLVGNREGNVYSYKPGQEKEQLLEGMSTTYVNEAVRWWKLGDKYYTVLNRFFNVFNEDGVKAFQVPLADGDRISDVCQTEDGTVAAIWYSSETYDTNLVEIDTKTGEKTSKLALLGDFGIAGGAGAGVMIRDRDGVYTYDLKSGEKTWHMKFDKTTFDPMATGNTTWDFRLTEEGDIKLLAKDYYEEAWYEEEMTRVSFEELGKTILVYQVNYPSAELKEVVVQFNKENEKYYVYLDARESGTDFADYITQTSIELATGKGPDMIDYYCVDNITSMTQKGVFENLEPYMEKSGMKEEDYFPYTFRDWETGEGCYGLGFCMQLDTLYMKEELVTGVESLETLLDSLESYEEDAVFSTIYERFPSTVLNYFLYMSTDAYDMLDWENGTCDFSGDLWERLLENSLRYGQGSQKVGAEEITERVIGENFQHYAIFDMEARSKGMVPLGYPTEDGMAHRIWVDSICMNAASENKEGVWEFMEYLLSAKSQQTLSKLYFPVLRSEYNNAYRKELANPSIVDVVDFEEVYVTEEQLEMITEFLEGAQAQPLNTEYVIDIIMEEADSYFSGAKTIEQVSDIIENRIGMYMAENQ